MNTWYNKAKLVGVLGALCLTVNLATAAPLKEGDAFPDLAAYGLEGTIPDLQGKVVLIDFFASWCGPCKDSFPAMETLYQKYADKGLVIVAINLDKKKVDMEKFLQGHPATFVILRDGANKLVSEVKIPTMPSSFLLDGSGKVVSAHRGFKGDETVKQYEEEIESLLK